MDWEDGIKDLYDELVSHLPVAMKDMISQLLLDATKKQCLNRNAGRINKADLFTALFEITPKAFRNDAVEICKGMGIDANEYVELMEVQQVYHISWDKVGKAFHPANVHFSMYITDKCNMNCLHCAAQERTVRQELTIEQWKQIIENLECSLRKIGKRGVYIWFGGEPTCRTDIKELIKYCADKGYYQSLITNGINFTEEFAKYCADKGMQHIFVSLDSVDPEKCDHIRGHKDALKYATQAIKNGIKYGMFTCVSTTVMKLNIDELQDIKDYVEELGAQPYFRAIVRYNNAAVNWNEIGLSQEEYKKLYEFKYKNSIKKIQCGDVGMLPVYDIFEMVPFMEDISDKKEIAALEWGVGCQACRCFNGIDINGDIFPCGYPSKLKLGNALTDSYEDVINSQLFKDIRDKKRVGKCADCHHLSLCGGGCRIQAEYETGNFFESFSYCWHDKNQNTGFDSSKEEN